MKQTPASIRVRDVPKGSPVREMLFDVAYCLTLPTPKTHGGELSVEEWLCRQLRDRPISGRSARSCPTLDAYFVELPQGELRELILHFASGMVRHERLRELQVFEVLNARFHRPTKAPLMAIAA